MARIQARESGERLRRWSGWGGVCFGALLLAGLTLPLGGCGTAELDTLEIAPTSQSVAVGATAQFTASGVIGHGSHPSSTQDVTDEVAWSSSNTAVATISSAGVASGVSAGTVTITATINGFTGVLTATATLTVSSSGSGINTASGTITSLSISPSAQSVSAPGDTFPFTAIGTNSTGSTFNLSSEVAWSSSNTQIATIGASTGLATAIGQGTATITALYTSNGSTLTSTATFTVTAGTTEEFTALSILPTSQSVSAVGSQTGQFIAIATSGTTGLEENVTDSPVITWISSIPTIATVSADGVATGVSPGTTDIIAELTNPDNSVVVASATVTVTLTPVPEPLLSLSIIPSSITVDNLQDTGQFLAIGTFSTNPTVQDVTNSPQTTWISAFPDVFPVDNSNGTGTGTTGGIVTAYGSGSATIIAEYTDPTTGSIQTATATFNCPEALPNPNGDPPTPGTCVPGTQAPALTATITVYNEGLNTTGWLVTGPSATGTPDVIHCGPGWTVNGGAGGSVCSAAYPIGTTITLAAPAETGVNFGGWSSSCTTISPNPSTEAGPNTCTFTLDASNPNVTIGAIFN